MGAEAVVLSFLYSLLMSMGLIGGSYQDIANAFPDNTTAQNSILYSVANDPMLKSPFDIKQAETTLGLYELVGLANASTYLQDNFNALMADLGFAVVDNNVQVAVSNGFNPSPSASQWVGTLKAVTGDEVVVSYYGNTNTPFRYVGDTLPDNFPIQLGWPTISGQVGNMAVWRWVYDDQVVYSTSSSTGTQPYFPVFYNTTGQFEIVNGTLQFVQYQPNGSVRDRWTFAKQNWINQGIAIDDAITFEPSESVVLGEEYLSFGDTDNPVVGVTYDPSTGVTTYKYKDGTISTTPPAVLGDSVALSPSITQPLTNYIINEGDITNIYNPDAAIPSDSSVPFDFTALGDTIISVFKPTVNFSPEPMFNRFKNKFDPQAYWDKMVKKWQVTPHRPSYPVTINWLGKSVTFDFWDWCDVLLNQQNYMLYRFFVRFFVYCGYVLLIGQLILGLFNIKLTPHVEDSTILGFRG